MIALKKAFYGERIPQSNCARKETVDIKIRIASRNGDRKIVQSRVVLPREQGSGTS